MLQSVKTLDQLTAAFPDEETCIAHFRGIRWANGAYCPYCGGTRVYNFSDGRTHKCGDCRKRFSIKVGTIFEDTKLPLRKWFIAIWLLTSHRKGNRQHSVGSRCWRNAKNGVVYASSLAPCCGNAVV